LIINDARSTRLPIKPKEEKKAREQPKILKRGGGENERGQEKRRKIFQK